MNTLSKQGIQISFTLLFRTRKAKSSFLLRKILKNYIFSEVFHDEYHFSHIGVGSVKYRDAFLKHH